MTKKSIDDLIAMATDVTKQAAASGEATTSTPELMEAIQSVATQIKRTAGADSQLAALVDQVQTLAKNTDKK